MTVSCPTKCFYVFLLFLSLSLNLILIYLTVYLIFIFLLASYRIFIVPILGMVSSLNLYNGAFDI